MLIKLKNKFTKDIVYFRFFSERYEDSFWFTHGIDNQCEWDVGKIEYYTPVKNTWEKMRKQHEKEKVNG